jgi:signal transduction histidine kinase
MGVRAPGRGVRWISINSQPMPAAEGGSLAAVVATFTDITRQRQLTADLRQAQADLQEVLDNVPARITSWRPDLTNRFANRVAEEQFGIPRGTAPGRHLREMIGEERYFFSEPYIAAALAGVRQSLEVKDRQADGTFRYARGEWIPEVRDGQVVGLFAVATDFTDQRNSHQRIRDLVRRLEGVRNEERRAAAHQLHEGIAQDLAAVKYALGRMQDEATGRAGVTEACGALGTAIDRCIESTRTLANDLQPQALAHLPLHAALQDHAAVVAQRTGLRVSVAEIPPFPVLDEQTKLVFFRAAQEALANAARHARATAVFLVLRADANRVALEVSDDGVGIHETDLLKKGALGLLGISEQFAVLGGGMEVARRERQGTMLTFTLPPNAAGRAA